MRRALLLLLALAACQMSDQPRYGEYQPSPLFADGASLQAPPDGTVPLDFPSRAATLADRPALTPVLLARGQQRFGIYCTPCHGISGDGDGIVTARGFPHPPSYADPRLLAAPSSYFVDVITNGHGVMYPYADRVSPADRWAIAAWIRALQASLATPADRLPPEDRARLAEARP